MDLSHTVLELIDFRSFSNLWYWIAIAVVWSSASHWVLGVPWDLALRAKRKGGQLEKDFQALVAINVNRILYTVDIAGMWLVGIVSFVLTGLAVMGFGYSVEFAQAVFLIALPMSFVGAMSVRTSRHIQGSDLEGDGLRKRLARHRLGVQVIGMISIFVTSLWGMYQNLVVSPLG
ncbi:component of SufBCD complex [Shimia sp. MMG029]|uniref:component of SufBCD complex n=1 Tax=Shimia sp. MMG029 TaxID=3021978 RepID=UPI0022FDBBC6|nr:component of SufBCD complex [Shimia sp. MMG029]MDA5555940.1 component of SufBCD complex [Shimia sp. MMG029]